MPAPKTQPAGGELYAYYNSNTNASPTWVLMGRLGDVDFQQSLATGQAKMRGSDWAKEVPGRFSLGMTATYNRTRNTDTVYSALRTAYLAKTPLQLAFCDRPVAESGAKGTKAYFLITKMDSSEPLEGPWVANLEFKHCEFEEGGNVIEPADFTTA